MIIIEIGTVVNSLQDTHTQSLTTTGYLEPTFSNCSTRKESFPPPFLYQPNAVMADRSSNCTERKECRTSPSNHLSSILG